MRRSETIKFRITPELKEGLKLLFDGSTYSNAFEDMAKVYIDDKLERLELKIEIEKTKHYKFKGKSQYLKDVMKAEVSRLRLIYDICDFETII